MNNLNKLCCNVSCKSTYKYKKKMCKPKSNFVSRDKVIKTFGKNIFYFAVRNGTTYVDCNSPVMICVLTCNRCSLHYVKKTAQKLKKLLILSRFISLFSYFQICFIFSLYIGNVALEGNGLAARNHLAISITLKRKLYQKTWVLKLETVYPYDLNVYEVHIRKILLKRLLIINSPLSLENTTGFFLAIPTKTIILWLLICNF